jgi:hypothetical protein
MCLVVLLTLGIFSFIAGGMLEISGCTFTFTLQRYLHGMPLPPLTQWFQALYIARTDALFTLCLFPTAFTSAYFWYLLRRVPDPVERHTRFALAAIACFVLLTGFLLLGIFSFALGFLTMLPGTMSGPPPPTPPLQVCIRVGFIVLLLANAVLFVQMLLSLGRNKHDSHATKP